MVKEKNFAEDRVKGVYDRIMKCRKKGTQGRIDSFFKISSVSKTGANKAEKKGKKGKVNKKGAQVKRKSESKKPTAKKIKGEN